jgi:hypothetical protein
VPFVVVEGWLQRAGRSGIVSCAQTSLGWRCPVKLAMPQVGTVSLVVVVWPVLSVVRQWLEATVQHPAALCGRCGRDLPLLSVCVLQVAAVVV